MSALLAGTPVLVTGGAGFIGSHLVEALVRRGARVTVVDDLSSGRESNLAGVAGVELLRLDLRCDELSSLFEERRFAAVFHLAGNVDIAGSVEDPRADLETNALATLRLLEAARRTAPACRFLFASSAAVYGDLPRPTLSESDPTFPVAPYGVGKLAAERYVAVYARLHGLPGLSLRLFSVFGPRLRKHVVHDLMCKIRDNPRELLIQGDGTQVRDLNHVANVVEAFLAGFAHGRLEGEVYNVAGGEAVSIEELARRLCRRMGAAPRFAYTGGVRPGHAQQWRADITRIGALGYRAGVGLDQGLDDTVAWFLGAPPS